MSSSPASNDFIRGHGQFFILGCGKELRAKVLRGGSYVSTNRHCLEVQKISGRQFVVFIPSLLRTPICSFIHAPLHLAIMHLIVPTIFTVIGKTSARPGSIQSRQSSESGTYSVTPHPYFSSSVGILGCKIHYNRVAYWPMAVDCDSMCVRLSYQGKSTTVLHIDQAAGAYDISYDAWSQLYCGVPGTAQTCVGGGVDMECKQDPFGRRNFTSHQPPVACFLKSNTDPETDRRMGRHVPVQRHPQWHRQCRQAPILGSQLHEHNQLMLERCAQQLHVEEL